MSSLQLTNEFSVWTDTARENDATKALRDGVCDSPGAGGGGYRVGKQVGGTATLSKSLDLEAIAIGEIVGYTGNCVGVRRIHPTGKSPYREAGVGRLG